MTLVENLIVTAARALSETAAQRGHRLGDEWEPLARATVVATLRALAEEDSGPWMSDQFDALGDTIEDLDSAGGNAMTTNMSDPWQAAALIRLLPNEGWTEYVWGDSANPDVVAYTRAAEFHADMIVIRAFDTAAACRAVVMPGQNPFGASLAVWSLIAPIEDVARAISDLVLPEQGAGPHPIPDACRVPPEPATTILPPRRAW
jgi:hypothetical protein